MTTAITNCFSRVIIHFLVLFLGVLVIVDFLMISAQEAHLHLPEPLIECQNTFTFRWATILEMLKNANGETEYIRVAQGKNKLPVTIKEAYKQLKTEIKWITRK